MHIKPTVQIEGLNGDSFTFSGCMYCYAKHHTPLLIGCNPFQLYRSYKDGILPFSGGELEQPARYVQAMHIIRILSDDTKRNKIEEMKNKRS